MGTESGTASMGATVFFGLTIMALATQGEVEITYANPSVTMGKQVFEKSEEVPVKEVSFEMPEASRFSDAMLALAAGPFLAPETVLDASVPALEAPRLRPQVQIEASAPAEIAPPERSLTVPRALVRDAPRAAIPMSPTASDLDRWIDVRERPWFALVTGDFVHMRSAPSVSGDVIDLFDTGTQARVIEERGDWLRIEIDGRIGWMFAGYLARQEN